MLEAWSAVAEFLSQNGAMEDVSAIATMLTQIGHPMPEDSTLHWRALISAMKKELDNSREDTDYVFLFERVAHLFEIVPQELCKALFSSPIFMHLLVERFAIAFDGLDAEVFKLESDELCQAEGIYEICLALQDSIDPNKNGSELATFLGTFSKIFEQDEPKECWEVFYDMHHLSDASFRRDMKRALCVVEAAALGPTRIEAAFPSKILSGTSSAHKKLVSKALLHKKFNDLNGTEGVWKDLSAIHCVAKPCQAQERRQRSESVDRRTSTASTAPTQTPAVESTHIWSTRVPFDLNGETVNGDAPESPLSEISDAGPAFQRPVTSRPRHSGSPAPAARRKAGRSAPTAGGRSTAAQSDSADALALRSRKPRKKNNRWTEEEKKALLDGYKLYNKRPNVWILIKNKFADELRARSNVDLKDKYRNLLKYGQVPHDD